MNPTPDKSDPKIMPAVDLKCHPIRDFAVELGEANQMKNHFQEAIREIQFLRHENEVLSAQMRVVNVFAAALNNPSSRGEEAVRPDVVYHLNCMVDRFERLEKAIQRDQALNARLQPQTSPGPAQPSDQAVEDL